MGNCICPQRKNSGEGSPYVPTTHPNVNRWIASSDFSSVPEVEEAVAQETSSDEAPEEVPYRPGPTAVSVTEAGTSIPDGFETAPEEQSEEEEDGEGSQISHYLTSDEKEEKEASRCSPVTALEHPSTTAISLISVQSTDDEDTATPQMDIYAENQFVRPMPTPIREGTFSPSVNLEKLAYRNGRVNRKKIGRLFELKKNIDS